METSHSSESSHCYQLNEISPELYQFNQTVVKQGLIKDCACNSLNSLKQSQSDHQPQYIANTIEDDMAASAISLDISQSGSKAVFQTNQVLCHQNAVTSFRGELTKAKASNSADTTATGAEKDFLLDSGHKNDLECSQLVKVKAKGRPRCYGKMEKRSVLMDQTSILANIDKNAVVSKPVQLRPQVTSMNNSRILSMIDQHLQPGDSFGRIIASNEKQAQKKESGRHGSRIK